jgi:hypothetical protein
MRIGCVEFGELTGRQSLRVLLMPRRLTPSGRLDGLATLIRGQVRGDGLHG